MVGQVLALQQDPPRGDSQPEERRLPGRTSSLLRTAPRAPPRGRSTIRFPRARSAPAPPPGPAAATARDAPAGAPERLRRRAPRASEPVDGPSPAHRSSARGPTPPAAPATTTARPSATSSRLTRSGPPAVPLPGRSVTPQTVGLPDRSPHPPRDGSAPRLLLPAEETGCRPPDGGARLCAAGRFGWHTIDERSPT